jgi:hypothetical protein
MGFGMELRLIAAASLVAFAAQGCYRPMYSSPYGGYPSQGYPVGGGYPGSIQTTVPGQPYAPGTMMPMGTPGGAGSVPTYPSNPTYNPNTGGPSATNPVPMYKDAQQFQAPDTGGGRELGYSPGGNGLIQTAGTTPAPAEPNQFAPSNPAPMFAQPTFEPTPTPATVTSDNFEGGNSPTTFK